VHAQTRRATRRVGVLMPSTQAREDVTVRPFFDRMRDLGWIEGKNVLYDRRYANDDHARLRALADDLIRRNPDALFAPTLLPAQALKAATRTIPIIFALPAPADSLGLVSNLARPEANVTGVTTVGTSLAPKRAELLKRILPQASRIGVLFDPADSASRQDRAALEEARSALGLSLLHAPVASVAELDGVMTRLLGQSPDAIVMLAGPTMFNSQRRAFELAAARKVAVTASNVDAVKDGALFSYSNSLSERLRYAARYVDRILKGAQPNELPVEQNAHIEFVINLRTARALGIQVPPSILLRADRVIE